MIASLTGTVQLINPNSIVLDVSGVGYLANVTPSTSSSLALGEQLQLFTVLVVREDALTIYGFLSSEEQRLFDLLRSVSGVGPKSALAILGSLSGEQIFQAVADEDDTTFKSVPGIGPKTAKLITVSLAGKVSLSQSSKSLKSDDTVVAALIGLGYSEKASRAAVAHQKGSTQEILRAALSIFSRGGSA